MEGQRLGGRRDAAVYCGRLSLQKLPACEAAEHSLSQYTCGSHIVVSFDDRGVEQKEAGTADLLLQPKLGTLNLYQHALSVLATAGVQWLLRHHMLTRDSLCTNYCFSPPHF